jgi:hypothetical protein
MEYEMPAVSALTGTVTVIADTALTGSGTLFTSELSPGDWVLLPSGQYAEVQSVTDNLNAVVAPAWGSPEGPVSASVTAAEPPSFAHHRLTTTSGGIAPASGLQVLSASEINMTGHASDTASAVLIGQTINDFGSVGAANRFGIVIGDLAGALAGDWTSNFGGGIFCMATGSTFKTGNVVGSYEGVLTVGLAPNVGVADGVSPSALRVQVNPNASDHANAVLKGILFDLDTGTGSAATKMAISLDDSEWDYVLNASGGKLDLTHSIPDITATLTDAHLILKTNIDAATTIGAASTASSFAIEYAIDATGAASNAIFTGIGLGITNDAENLPSGATVNGLHVGDFNANVVATSYGLRVGGWWKYALRADSGRVSLTATPPADDLHLVASTTSPALGSNEELISIGSLLTGHVGDASDSDLVGFNTSVDTTGPAVRTAFKAGGSNWDYAFKATSGLVDLVHTLPADAIGIQQAHVTTNTTAGSQTASGSYQFGHSTTVTSTGGLDNAGAILGGVSVTLVPHVGDTAGLMVGQLIGCSNSNGAANRVGLYIAGQENLNFGIISDGIAWVNVTSTSNASRSAVQGQIQQTVALGNDNVLYGTRGRLTPYSGTDGTNTKYVGVGAQLDGNSGTNATSVGLEIEASGGVAWDYAIRSDSGLVDLTATLPDQPGAGTQIHHAITTTTGDIDHASAFAFGSSISVTSGEMTAGGIIAVRRDDCWWHHCSVRECYRSWH